MTFNPFVPSKVRVWRLFRFILLELGIFTPSGPKLCNWTKTSFTTTCWRATKDLALKFKLQDNFNCCLYCECEISQHYYW